MYNVKIKHFDYSYAFMKCDNFYVTKNILSLLEAEVPDAKWDPRVKKGIWDGIVKFYKPGNGMIRIPFGFISFIEAYCKENDIIFEDVNKIDFLQRFTKIEVDEFIQSLDLKFQPRDYQLTAIYKALGANNGLYKMATGSGKSLTQSIIATFLYFKYNIKILLIVPSVSLVHQFYSDMEEYFENTKIFKIQDHLHKIYAGEAKHIDKGITITTWQSINKVKELIDGVDCIIVDEVQTAKNKDGILTELMTNYATKVKFKFGFTGTIPRIKINQLNLIGNFGKVNDIIDAKGLIDRGFGTPMDIICLFLRWPKDLCNELPHDYNEEVKYLEHSETRNSYISGLAKKVTNNFGNTLILFNTIAHGESIVQSLLGDGEGFLPKLTKMKLEQLLDKTPNISKVYVNIEPSDKQLKTACKVLEKRNISCNGFFHTLEDNNIFFVYGKVDDLEREEIRKRVETKTKCIIVASYATFSTGINITNLCNLIFASSTKSYERLIQSLGRTIRKHDDKLKVRVFDLIDDLRVKTVSRGEENIRYENKLYSHFLERIEMYRSEGHTILERIHVI